MNVEELEEALRELDPRELEHAIDDLTTTLRTELLQEKEKK